MILNGKAKEDFGEYFYERFSKEKGLDTFKFLKELEKLELIDSIIIEWFDSVGVYIEPRKYAKGWGFDFFGLTKLTQEEKMYATRSEATTKAIEKAVETFNNLHNGK